MSAQQVIYFSIAGIRGRPAIQITRDQIEFLMKQGHTVKRMSRILGCSSSFLYKRSKLLGLSVRSRMAGVDDEELENVVRRLQCQYPNSGNEVSLVGLTLKSVLKVHQVINFFFFGIQYTHFR